MTSTNYSVFESWRKQNGKNFKHHKNNTREIRRRGMDGTDDASRTGRQSVWEGQGNGVEREGGSVAGRK